MFFKRPGFKELGKCQLRQASVCHICAALEPFHFSLPAARMNPAEIETRRNVMGERGTLEHDAVGVKRFEGARPGAVEYELTEDVRLDERDLMFRSKCDNRGLALIRYAVAKRVMARQGQQDGFQSMLLGGTLEPFETQSRARLVWDLERSHLQGFERLKVLVTPGALDSDDISGFRNSPDCQVERFGAARCDDNLVRGARRPLTKHQARHLTPQPDVSTRLLICDGGVIKCGKRKPHRSVQSS